MLEEFDVKKYERSLRAEGYEEGIECGIKQGSDSERARNSTIYEKYSYELCYSFFKKYTS